MLRKKDNEPSLDNTGPTSSTPSSSSKPSGNAPGGSKSEGSTTIIGENIHFLGDAKGTTDLIIAGNFKGNVELPNNKVTISPTGVVEAKIHAKNIVVQGRINGELNASDTAQFLASGVFHGEVKTKKIHVEKECDFNGSIHMLKQGGQQTTQQAPPTTKQADSQTAPSILKDAQDAAATAKVAEAKK